LNLDFHFDHAFDTLPGSSTPVFIRLERNEDAPEDETQWVRNKSMPSHAVVEVEPGKTKPDQLVAAVNGVKGSGWHCTAQLMK
jgi:hypothetical protein